MPVEHRDDVVVGASHRREDRDDEKDEVLRPGTHSASRVLAWLDPSREGRDHGGAVFVTLEVEILPPASRNVWTKSLSTTLPVFTTLKV